MTSTRAPLRASARKNSGSSKSSACTTEGYHAANHDAPREGPTLRTVAGRRSHPCRTVPAPQRSSGRADPGSSGPHGEDRPGTCPMAEASSCPWRFALFVTWAARGRARRPRIVAPRARVEASLAASLSLVELLRGAALLVLLT